MSRVPPRLGKVFTSRTWKMPLFIYVLEKSLILLLLEFEDISRTGNVYKCHCIAASTAGNSGG